MYLVTGCVVFLGVNLTNKLLKTHKLFKKSNELMAHSYFQ